MCPQFNSANSIICFKVTLWLITLLLENFYWNNNCYNCAAGKKRRFSNNASNSKLVEWLNSFFAWWWRNEKLLLKGNFFLNTDFITNWPKRIRFKEKEREKKRFHFCYRILRSDFEWRMDRYRFRTEKKPATSIPAATFIHFTFHSLTEDAAFRGETRGKDPLGTCSGVLKPWPSLKWLY